MSLQRYEEALACGLSKREASYVGFAEDLAAIFRQQREENEAFAADIGYTMAEIRALPVEDHPFVQDLYAAWRINRPC
jgi:hypothetical protein